MGVRPPEARLECEETEEDEEEGGEVRV